jgi:poly(beta-D-mannuronate) lyase
MIKSSDFRFILICALSLTAAVSFAEAREIPVAGLADFNQAVSQAAPGDAIVFKNGSYKDLRLDLKAAGTESAPITLRAETPGQVVFGGKSQLIIDGDWLVVSGFKYDAIADVPNITTPYGVLVGAVAIFPKTTNHSRLTETAIVNSGNAVSSYFHMEPGGQYNKVDHCWFSGQKGIGMSLYIEADKDKPSYAVMEDCFIGNRAQGTGNRWETIRIGHSEQQYNACKATVIGNYFTKCDGENEMVSNKSTGNKYLYNTFVDNKGEMALRHGEEAWVEGNFFFADKTSSPAIRIIGSKHVIINNYLKKTSFGFNIYTGETNPEPAGYTQVKDVLIAFNTLEDCGDEFQIGTSGRPMPPKNVRVAYNLVQSSGGTILNYDNSASEILYEGNIMYGGSGASRAGVTTDKPALLNDKWGRIVADPAKLPIKVDASSVPQVTKDLNGTARGNAPNVGAIQSPDGKPLYPLSPQEVGPLWMGRVPDAVAPAARSPKEGARLLSAVPGNVRGTVRLLLPLFDGKPVTVEVRDARGTLVRSLKAEEDRITWDGRDGNGRVAARGTYLFSAMMAGRVVSRSAALW